MMKDRAISRLPDLREANDMADQVREASNRLIHWHGIATRKIVDPSGIMRFKQRHEMNDGEREIFDRIELLAMNLSKASHALRSAGHAKDDLVFFRQPSMLAKLKAWFYSWGRRAFS